MIKILYSVLFVVSVIHVFEEYYTGWLDYAREYVIHIRKIVFIIVNIIFLVLALISTIAMIISGFHFFNAIIVSLIFINALIHILPAIKAKKYLPGLYSALFGYLPISVYILVYHILKRELTLIFALYAFILGLIIMSLPFFYQIVIKKSVSR
mgnify:CR=1 FL=1